MFRTHGALPLPKEAGERIDAGNTVIKFNYCVKTNTVTIKTLRMEENFLYLVNGDLLY